MNLKKIKQILDSDISDNRKEQGVINVLSEDENIIPILMKILDSERKNKEEISIEMNLLLSKAEVGLEDDKFNKDKFINKEIITFYRKYEGTKGVGHCFRNINAQS